MRRGRALEGNGKKGEQRKRKENLRRLRKGRSKNVIEETRLLGSLSTEITMSLLFLTKGVR